MLVLEHQPKRISYGFSYVFGRSHAANWRRVIAESLLHDSPIQLPHWRWDNLPWPGTWQQIREHPIRTSLERLFVSFPYALKSQWDKEGKLFPSAVLTPMLMHVLICFKFMKLRRQQQRARAKEGGPKN
jgi:hypothetical protein